jgi:glycosyltransferase involved in cell wall biosynthesis
MSDVQRTGSQVGYSAVLPCSRQVLAAVGLPARMHITLAAHFVYTGQVGGAEHMFYNLVRGLAGRNVSLNLLCARISNLAKSFRKEVQLWPNVNFVANKVPGPRFIAEQAACFASSLTADAVIFPNYFVPPIIPRRLGAVICVLHDMQYRHMRMNFSARKRLWLRLAHNLAVRRCDRMITISEFVRQDAIRFLGAQFADRIDVVPNPISWDRFLPADTPGPSGGRPTILSVAAQYEHKNLATLIRAFAEVRRRLPDAQLILCGQDYRSLRGVAGKPGTLRELADALDLGNSIVITGYVDDAALGQLFRLCTVFAFPSVFEGFGMPPIEALGLGLPTLTTRETALPEVTLGLAQYVDKPHDVGEWSERLSAMLRDPASFSPDVAAVAELRARYSPSLVAQRYLDVCRKALR